MDIKYKIVKPEDIDDSTKRKMFHLMDLYYANTFLEIFLKDLNDKTDVILLSDLHSDELVGFSTQKILSLQLMLRQTEEFTYLQQVLHPTEGFQTG